MEKRNFNEALKQRELREREESARRAGDKEMTLDDAARVKVLSPGMLVFKRFIRNKLAIVGSTILIVMFLFAFIGPYFYRYGQTEVFNTYKPLNINYANAEERTEHTVYLVEDQGLSTNTKNMFNSAILTMEDKGLEVYVLQDKANGKNAVVEKKGENIYTMSVGSVKDVATYAMQDIGTFNGRMGLMAFAGADLGQEFTDAAKAAVNAKQSQFDFNGSTYLLQSGSSNKEYKVLGAGVGSMKYVGANLGSEFAALVNNAAMAGGETFQFNGKTYSVTAAEDGKYAVTGVESDGVAYVSSTFVFDTVEAGTALSDEFKVNALLAIYGAGEFTADGKTYTVKTVDDELSIYDASGSRFAAVSTFVVRRYNGEDSLSLEFKAAAREVVMRMEEQKLKTDKFTFDIPQLDEQGQTVLDENGKVKLVESTITVTDKATTYVLVCEQYTYMLDRFAGPTSEHPFGTDGDGMDILARMMAGGRVSLLVGFVVVILEVILGVIMGGIAGYFGGWVDNLIMRLVDIFYCIPSMPILIIMGAMLDAMRVEPYVRLMWLMAILGFLGWAGIARLVRGQILSLREQDFMVATEACGLPVRRRIFRHLIPNVMPQLIVSATMGLGSVILTESTLSFLGLGVKHPMATWGTMINSVATSAQAMTEYTYIWIPVGCLICLTVVAFNFVGDGLRDAFDPKMKR